MLDLNYEQGLDALRAIIQRRQPELFDEFSLYQFRLLECLQREHKYGQNSNNSAERNQVLDQLIQFTTEHFALQFIDLCRSKHVAEDTMPVKETTPASNTRPHETIWTGGCELFVQGTRYMIHEPIETEWALDRSALLQQAKALEIGRIGASRMVFLKQVQVQRATERAGIWKTAMEKEMRLLDDLEQQRLQQFPRRLAFEQSIHSVTLVYSTISGHSWQQEFGLSNAPLNISATRSLLKSAISLCELLRVLHTKNVAHRALSPEKIFRLNGQQTLLQELGLATRKYEPGEGPQFYRAPEQATSNKTLTIPGPHTDVYQLGMILYHLITANLPTSPTQVLPVHTWNPHLPAELDRVLQRAIVPNAKERWRTITEFAVALKKVFI